MSDIHAIGGTKPKDNRNQRLFCSFWQQWSSLFGRCNWYDFDLLHIGGEFAPYTGRWELRFQLLGFGMEVQYVYDQSFNENMKDVVGSIRTELEGRTGLEMKDPLGVLDKLSHTKEKQL